MSNGKLNEDRGSHEIFALYNLNPLLQEINISCHIHKVFDPMFAKCWPSLLFLLLRGLDAMSGGGKW